MAVNKTINDYIVFYIKLAFLVIFVLAIVRYHTKENSINKISKTTGESEKQLVSNSYQKETSKFVYMITSCDWNNDFRLNHSKTRYVIRLTFCKEIKQYPKRKLDIIYAPNTTWNDARNILLDYSLSKLNPPQFFEYFIFLDGDMLNSMVGGVNVLNNFEKWLLKTKPVIGYMIGSSIWMEDFKSLGNTNIDPNVAAHHKSSLGLAIPYDNDKIMEKESWYYGTWINNVLASVVYPTQRIGFHGVNWNYSRSEHSQSENYPRKRRWEVPVTYLNRAIFKNSTLRPGFQYLFGDREPISGSIARFMCPTFCLKTSETCNRTQDLCDRKLSKIRKGVQPVLTGPPDLNWILNNFKKDHEFTKKLIDFHKKHVTYLNKVRVKSFDPQLLI